MITFIIEAVALCTIFTILVLGSMKKPLEMQKQCNVPFGMGHRFNMMKYPRHHFSTTHWQV